MGPTNFFRFRWFFELQYFELHNFYCIHNTTEVANMLHCCPIYDQISRDFDAFASTSIDANRSLTCDGLLRYMVHFVLLRIYQIKAVVWSHTLHSCNTTICPPHIWCNSSSWSYWSQPMRCNSSSWLC